MHVTPPPSRVQIAADGTRVAIEIPARRNWFIVLFLGAWLCGWAVGETMAATKLIGGEALPLPGTFFMLAWLCAWTLGGAAAIAIFSWTLAGREVITITPTTLSIRRQVRALGFTRSYDLSHLSRLRLDTHPYNSFDPRMALAFYGLGGGRLAFDYGSSTVRFANSIDDPDALKIVEACKTLVPMEGG